MSSRMKYGILTVAAAIALILVIVDFVVAQTNRSIQIEIGARQQFINQSIELSRVNEALVHALAVAAVRNNDPKLREILTAQGITVRENQAPVAPATPAPPASSARTKDHK